MPSRSTRTESHLPGPSRDRFWLAAGILVLALHVISFQFFEIDDAYISFRYARNLLDGHGLVFNPGDPVEGYSNLLWVLISALGMALGIDPLLWARTISFCAAVGIVILTPAMVRRLDPQAGWVAGAGAVLVACWGPLACWSLAGLETVFCAFLMLLAWQAALTGRSLTVGVVSWLLALTRPDGLALGAACVLWLLLPGGESASQPGDDSTSLSAGNNRSRPWRCWVGPTVFLLGIVAHFLWQYATYGEWLPNTYYAKTGDLLGQLRTGLPYAADFLRSYAAPWIVVGLWATWVTGGNALRSPTMGRTLAVCGLWFLYTLAIGGDMLGMFRFFVPILPLLAAAGTALLSRALKTDPTKASRLLAGGIVVLLAFMTLLPSAIGKERRLITAHMSSSNLGGWKLVGDALASHLPASTTIALGPAGYIPYKTGFVTYDLLGVTDRHIAHQKMAFTQGYAGHEKHDGTYIIGHRPDYLLLGNVDVTDQPRRSLIPPFAREVDILTQPVFQRDYEQVALPLAGGKYVNCFKRKDLPLETGIRLH